MRLRDNPTVQVTERLSCSPERAWDLVTDIELPTRAAGELQRVEWLDGADSVAVGNRFRGHNANPQLGEWHTDPEIVEVDRERRWVWRVGPSNEPVSLWGFEVDPDGDGSLVRQWAKLFDSPSPLRDAIEQQPEQEGRILDQRLGVWRSAMEANMELLRESGG